MIVTFPLEMEQEVKTKAARKGLDVMSYLFSLVKKDTTPAVAFEQTNDNGYLDAGKQGIKEFYVKTGLPFSASPQEVWDKLNSLDQGDDEDPDALNRAVASLLNRTPEQKREAREQAIRESQPQIALPANVSIFDVIPVIRGNETDAEVRQALKELS
jgi:hypothetical protein